MLTPAAALSGSAEENLQTTVDGPGSPSYVEHEAHVRADLARADRGRIERDHARVEAERAGLAQHVGQPREA